jgi:hypothetical protein
VDSGGTNETLFEIVVLRASSTSIVRNQLSDTRATEWQGAGGRIPRGNWPHRGGTSTGAHGVQGDHHSGYQELGSRAPSARRAGAFSKQTDSTTITVGSSAAETIDEHYHEHYH